MMPLANGVIEFSNSVSQKVSRHSTSTPEKLSLHSKVNQRPCSYCNRLPDAAGAWAEVDHLEVSQNLFPLAEMFPFVSMICPDCVDKLNHPATVPCQTLVST
jgi:hypothetical protein